MELLGKSQEELRAYCKSLGEPEYRGGQIYHALYAERRFDLAGMSNLPGALREKLAREASVTLPEVRKRYLSKDGSVRYLFGVGEDGKGFNAEVTEDAEFAEKSRRILQKPAAVEAVFMPSEGRQTICISTQAGCAVDCQFCLTAQLGLIRNLTAGEIVGQVLVPLKEMGEAPETNKGEMAGDTADDDEEDGQDVEDDGAHGRRLAGNVAEVNFKSNFNGSESTLSDAATNSSSAARIGRRFSALKPGFVV